jgi:threonine dehydratase
MPSAEQTNYQSLVPDYLKVGNPSLRDALIRTHGHRLFEDQPSDPLSEHVIGSCEREQSFESEIQARLLEDARPFTFQALQASQRIGDLLKETRLIETSSLSKGDFSLHLKPEHLQTGGSFKIRGSLNAIRKSNRNDYEDIVTQSAGNHAQGVARAAESVNKAAVVFMSERASAIKLAAVKALGAKVIKIGSNYDEASRACALYLRQNPGNLFVHPFDDPDVCIGQSTETLEIYRDQPDLSYLYFAVGGGGQIAHNAAVANELYGPNVQVVGVQLEGSAAVKKSVEAGRLVALDEVDCLSDGTAVGQGCQYTFDLINRYVSRIITVSPEEAIKAMVDLTEDGGEPVEVAGALSLAGIRKEANLLSGNVCAVISGGNISSRDYSAAKSRLF